MNASFFGCLGVPLGQMRLGSRFLLQVRTRRSSSLAGFPLPSVTRNTGSDMERRDCLRISPFKSNPALYPLSYTPVPMLI